jgi:cell division protein FtsB
MKQFERKRQTKRIMYSTITLLVLCLMVVMLARSAWAVYKNNRMVSEKRDFARLELARLLEKKVELESELEDLKTDRGAESEVREKYQVARPGEKTIIVIDNPAEATSTATTTESSGFLKTVSKFFQR